jgi:hypothetical protein
MNDELWPPLPYDAWKDTYETLHMWTQIVGKVALAQAPPLNHSWSVALQVTPRGLSTRTLPHHDRSFAVQFDFLDHQLVVQACDGATRRLHLRAQPVASFYREVMSTLEAMGLPVKIWPMPVEVPSPVRFDQDTVHRSYDPEYATRCWRIFSQAARLFGRSQCSFVGKSSPVHFFWGAFDLAVTRFSGRRAPAREGPAFMREAYSHEVISHGFWPGSGPVLEPAFYAYAVPEPPAFKAARILPDSAYYHQELGEFILPYDAVRNAPSPDEAVLAFIDSTYDRAATSAGWDRASLDRRPA